MGDQDAADCKEAANCVTNEAASVIIAKHRFIWNAVCRVENCDFLVINTSLNKCV
jgi:hypothetical protein